MSCTPTRTDRHVARHCWQAPVMLRLVFHDAATFDAAANDGGADASVQFELDRAENFGLKRGWRVIETAQKVAAEYRPLHTQCDTQHVRPHAKPLRTVDASAEVARPWWDLQLSAEGSMLWSKCQWPHPAWHGAGAGRHAGRRRGVSSGPDSAGGRAGGAHHRRPRH